MEGLEIRRVAWDDFRDELVEIRFTVFVQEQGVAPDEEIDGMDDSSVHFLAVKDGKNIGTARLMPNGQIGRMAVLAPYRNLGIGAKLLEAAIAAALAEGHDRPFLHAQVHALDFYAKHGFITHGELFLDAGIEHRAMIYSP